MKEPQRNTFEMLAHEMQFKLKQKSKQNNTPLGVLKERYEQDTYFLRLALNLVWLMLACAVVYGVLVILFG